MNAEEMAEHEEIFIRAIKLRTLGPGRHYETDGVMRFENMTPLQIIEYAREEVQDLANYAFMLDFQLAKLAKVLDQVMR